MYIILLPLTHSYTTTGSTLYIVIVFQFILTRRLSIGYHNGSLSSFCFQASELFLLDWGFPDAAVLDRMLRCRKNAWPSDNSQRGQRAY
jgi:hypothetical protein